MSKKVLIIDNDPSNTRLIEYVLKQRGYQVLTALNGLDGLAKAREGKIDLLIMDMLLPGMDGLEVCQRLRSEEKTAQLPILILSGRAQEIDRAMALKMGADEFVAKPAKPGEILKRVDDLLARHNVISTRIIAFISSRDNVGKTTTIISLAMAMSQMGKKVIIVDMCPYQDSVSERFGINPEQNLEFADRSTDNIELDDLEFTIVVHKTGVKVVRVFESPEEIGDTFSDEINSLFNKLGNDTDYLLVDMPFKPGVATGTLLKNADLSIIASECDIEALADIKSIVKVLHFLGVNSERTGMVVIDVEEKIPDVPLVTLKHFIESCLGINVLEMIPYSADVRKKSPSDAYPPIISNPDSPLASSVRELTQQIINRWEKTKSSPKTVVNKE